MKAKAHSPEIRLESQIKVAGRTYEILEVLTFNFSLQ